MASTKKTIARAIRKADKRYFFEDYNKQAAAVLRALKAEGLVVVPHDPSEAMVEKGKSQITNGSVRPDVLIKRIFAAMVKE